MAGSMRQMLYKTDIPDSAGTGRKYRIVNVDESNAKLTGGLEATPGNESGLEFAGDQDYIRLELRRLLLEGTTAGGKTVRRSIVACDPDNTLVANGGSTVMGVMVNNSSEDVTMYVSGVVGEKRTFRKNFDSGLDDLTTT